jgi:hypothetical protein
MAVRTTRAAMRITAATATVTARDFAVDEATDVRSEATARHR